MSHKANPILHVRIPGRVQGQACPVADLSLQIRVISATSMTDSEGSSPPLWHRSHWKGLRGIMGQNKTLQMHTWNAHG